MSSLQQRKISRIKTIVESGDYHGAAAEFGALTIDALTGTQQKTVDYLKLKVFNRLQWLVEAAPIADRLAEFPGLESDDHLEIALFYVLIANVSKAERFMKQAIALDKGSQLLASELAILYEQQGQASKALLIYDKVFASALARKRFDAVGARVLTRLAGLRELDNKEVKSLEQLCAKYVGEDTEVKILFGLAKAHARRGETDKEIACLIKANRLVDQFNETQFPEQTIGASRARLEGIRTLFDQPDPAWMQNYATSGRSPVFILGMPRSGTTLLEQILGAHSLIGNSGESRGMGIAFKQRLGSKKLLEEDEGKMLPFLRYKTLRLKDSQVIIDYYNRYQALFSLKNVVTDKELSNIDRLGMIRQFYPNSKFVVIRRHPLDVCVSILQQNFAGAWFSASSLKIIQEYEVYYEKVDHWQRLYPENVISLDYEALVSSFEENIQKVLDFLTLPWEKTLSDFYKRKNSVRTPSLSQVRLGVNSGSVEKWRKYIELIRPAQEYFTIQKT